MPGWRLRVAAVCQSSSISPRLGSACARSQQEPRVVLCAWEAPSGACRLPGEQHLHSACARSRHRTQSGCWVRAPRLCMPACPSLQPGNTPTRPCMRFSSLLGPPPHLLSPNQTHAQAGSLCSGTSHRSRRQPRPQDHGLGFQPQPQPPSQTPSTIYARACMVG